MKFRDLNFNNFWEAKEKHLDFVAKFSVILPVMVRVDNIGVTVLASNITTTSHTKHMDIRYKYVNECVEYGVVKIIFVKTAENDSDILTKN